MKKPNHKTLILAFGLMICLAGPAFSLNGQDEGRAGVLLKEISEVKESAGYYPLLEELKNIYFKDSEFDNFLAVLGPLAAKNGELEYFSAYYTALTRYQQLKYLEEKQKWEEYFANGNTYRNEITADLDKVIKGAKPNEPLYLESRLLLWRFYRDRQDPAAEPLLADLMSAAAAYAGGASRDVAALKNAADQLFFYNEKAASRQLYKLYVEKLVAASKNNAELKTAALDFYNAGNLELAEAIYDAYIERVVAAQGKGAIADLIEIARQFAYRDRGPNDPDYAEKVFARITELGGQEALSEELTYQRAFSLEKARGYPDSKERYLDLINHFPKSSYSDEAEFKVGIITTYIQRDSNTGRKYFEKLSQKENITPQVISSFYQLGLIAQWEGNNEEARKYYLALKEKAKQDFSETTALADERLKELDGGQPLEYNLKTFLDVSLRPENSQFDRTKIDLQSHPRRGSKDEGVNINASSYYGDNGCMQPEFQYLWSGHLGTLQKPDPTQSGFSTHYIHRGTKEINVVVVSPGGIVDRNLDMVDVYDPPATTAAP